MDVINLGRRYGKTTKMVEWLRETPDSVLVVVHGAEKVRILDQYFSSTPEEREEYEDRILTFNKALTLRGRRQTTIGIDNLDVILNMAIAPHRVGPVTITEEE